MSGNRSKQIAFNYFGGKFTFTERLIDHFPQHEHFVDVFCGSMAVTLNKPSSGIETANDINGNVINFFKVLREEPAELIRALSLTPVSRQEYDECWPISEGESALELARRFYVRVKQSYLGLCAQRKNKGWLHSSRNSRTKVAELVSKWFNGIEGLPMLVYRLQSIQIENQDFRRLIPRIDYPEAFFYCDPPYPKESRGSYKDYQHEFTNEDHCELAELLHQIKGKAMISGYDCQLMQELYGDWHFVRFPKKMNAVRSGISQECIWMNYDPAKEKGQMNIYDLLTQ